MDNTILQKEKVRHGGAFIFADKESALMLQSSH